MFSDLSISPKEKTPHYLIADSNLPFSEYITNCRKLIAERRLDLPKNPDEVAKIIDANAPYELNPADPISANQRIKKGALLIHGLWDSPFSLKEIGMQLQAKGVLSRAILLPGHGTRPSDLHQVTYDDWIQTVRYGVQSLQEKVEQVYLIGYSTGAALSIYHALHDKKIAGLILLAPAIRIKLLMDMVFNWHQLLKWATSKREWIYAENEIDYAKYKSIGFNPALQIYKLTHTLKELQETHQLNCPLFMSLSHEDDTISSRAAINYFLHSQNPDNQLLLYAQQQKKYADPRVSLRKTSYPNLSIKNLSHVALPFSKDNMHYGQHGDYIRASHHSDTTLYGAYNRVSENFYKPFYNFGLLKKYRRELTYNPDFDFMADAIVKFMLK